MKAVTASPRGRTQRWVGWAIVSLLWVMAAINLVRSYRLAMGRPGLRLGDFHVYLEATRWMRDGRPLYDFATDNGLGFTYPPFAAIALAPWGMLPDAVAETVWTLCGLAGCALFATIIGLRVVPTWSLSTRWALAGGLTAIFSQTAIVQAHLVAGQISLLLACLCLMESSRFLASHRWGALSGLATAIKLTPGLFLIHHLMNDRRRAAWSIGAAAVAALIGLVVLPAESFTYWTSKLWQTDRVGDVAFAGNLTWSGVVARLGLTGLVGRALGLLLGAATAVVALLNARWHWKSHPLAAAAIVGCASVVASPVSWHFHAVWLLAWAACAVLSRGWALRVVGVCALGLTLIWTPLITATGPQGASTVAALAVLFMSLAAVVRIRPIGMDPLDANLQEGEAQQSRER